MLIALMLAFTKTCHSLEPVVGNPTNKKENNFKKRSVLTTNILFLTAKSPFLVKDHSSLGADVNV